MILKLETFIPFESEVQFVNCLNIWVPNEKKASKQDYY
jgi:hypothetical protein